MGIKLEEIMKKGFVLFLLLLLTFLLVACGGGKEVTGNDATNEENEQLKKELEELKQQLATKETDQAENNSSGGTAEKIDGEEDIKPNAELDTQNFLLHVDYLTTMASNGYLELSEKGESFITENIDLFINQNSETQDKAKSLAVDIDVRELNKSSSKFLDTFVEFEGFIVEIIEDYYDEFTILTYAHVMDYDFNSYTVFMFGSAEGILEDDDVIFYGLPLGGYSFENVSGGYTNANLFFGSAIEKSN